MSTESRVSPVCAAVPIRPETMRSRRFDRSSRSCIRSWSSGSSISCILARVRCCTRSIAASAVRPLSIAALILRDVAYGVRRFAAIQEDLGISAVQ